MGLKTWANNVKKYGIREAIRKDRKRRQREREEGALLQELNAILQQNPAFGVNSDKTAANAFSLQESLMSMMDLIEQKGMWRSASIYGYFQQRLDEHLEGIAVLPESDAAKLTESLQQALVSRETSAYRRKLKADFIKKRIPAAYRSASVNPIEPKAIFVQPREGLNQSFKYMFKRLDEQGPYQPVLCELHRGDIPFSLYFRKSEAMARQAATAKVVFFHESNNLFGYVDVRSESKVVQLWHGCGIFKKIGLDTADLPGYKSSKSYRVYPEYNYYSCVTIASPELSWVFEQFMGISKESGIIKPLGVSRTDEFFDQAYIDRCYEKLYERIPEARDKKVILYAPTYRGVGGGRVAPDELDIPAMAERLGDTHILLIKQHQTAKNCPPVPESYDQSFAWDVTRGWGMDINELMTIADICVSDYSSLVFEYSIFERPMAFFVYDLEEYIDDRGLYYDFDEITPGPLCYTTEELIEYIESLERDGFDPAEVSAFKQRFMSSCDGHSTERILEYVEKG